MLPRLAPPAASRPPPSEWRASISTASFEWLETIVRPLSFSYQRKAGMSSLLPSSSPAWLAPVWDERSHSQGTIRCVPRSSQRAIVGACPSRRARRRTGSARPSISNRITPGTSVRSASRTRRARRLTTRSWRASSSMLSAGASRVRLTERKKAAAIASRKPGAEPSTSLTETATIAAFSTSEPRPKVRTVSGNRTRISAGQRRALSSATRPVVSSTASKLGTPKPGSRATTTQKISATSTQRISPAQHDPGDTAHSARGTHGVVRWSMASPERDAVP